MYQSSIKPMVISFSLAIILLSLSVWQLYRSMQKKQLIEQINYSMVNPAKIVADNFNGVSKYNRIALKGHFIKKPIYLYRRNVKVPGKDGYYLLYPFYTKFNQHILVAYGWVEHKNKKLIDEYDPNQIGSEIVGFIIPSETKSLFIPNNDLKNNIWFNLEVKEIAQYLQLDLNNDYLIVDLEQKLPNFIYSINSNNFMKIKNDHRSYAMTWFALAISILVIYQIYTARR